MNHFPSLFQTLELTRNIPLTGLAQAGLNKNQLPSLADHHYLTTLFSWQLARFINQKGGNLNLQRTLELSLIHDIGEIYPINNHFSNTNAPDQSKSLESLKQESFARLANEFAKDQKYLLELNQELSSQTSDEALVIQIAHTIDHLICLKNSNSLHEENLSLFENNLLSLSEKTKNSQNGLILKKITLSYFEELKIKISPAGTNTL